MSQNDINLTSAINLSDDPATILLNATDLKVILSEVQRLKTEVEAIHTTQKTYAIRTTNEIDELFERVELLEGKQKKSKIQEDRTDVLRAILAAHGGKMIAKDARRKMGLGESTFSRLIATMGKWIEIRPMKTNGRGYLLVLKTQSKDT